MGWRDKIYIRAAFRTSAAVALYTITGLALPCCVMPPTHAQGKICNSAWDKLILRSAQHTGIAIDSVTRWNVNVVGKRTMPNLTPRT